MLRYDAIATTPASDYPFRNLIGEGILPPDAQDEIEFNAHHVSGYPTTDNPYAAPPIWLQPDEGWVAMHLSPA